MANRDFIVHATKPGNERALPLRVTAADAKAARSAAEGSGWAVHRVEDAAPPLAEPATLDSIMRELQSLRARVDTMQQSSILRAPYWTIFWATILTGIILAVALVIYNAIVSAGR